MLGKVDASVATHVNWRAGEDCIIVPAVSDQEAATMFPDGWVAVRPYLGLVAQLTGERRTATRVAAEAGCGSPDASPTVCSP